MSSLAVTQEKADQEAQNRQQLRFQDLREQQDQIAEETLIRLGRWKQASEGCLRRRVDDLGVQSSTTCLESSASGYSGSARRRSFC